MEGDFEFSNGGAVASRIVNICDLGGVDSAIAQLCTSQVIGVDVLWQPEEVRIIHCPFQLTIFAQAGQYHPISVITLCSGSKSFSFQVPRDSRRLPMAIRLLLSHQDYLKVMYSARDIKIGKLFRDFDLKIL